VSYDTRCDELARVFLRDAKRDTDEAIVAQLAQRIQDSIEDFLNEQNIAA
jgi:hypothetical protein